MPSEPWSLTAALTTPGIRGAEGPPRSRARPGQRGLQQAEKASGSACPHWREVGGNGWVDHKKRDVTGEEAGEKQVPRKGEALLR